MVATLDSAPTILKTIAARKREEVDALVRKTPLNQLKKQCQSATPARGFVDAIESQIGRGESAVIAEIKKASPSKGILREDFRPPEIARSYARGGATCLSVLTDIDFFQGSDAYLVEARDACTMPVLRKDFTIDAYQIYESRAIGADCILLIAAILDIVEMQEYAAIAAEIGIDVLLEVHSQAELDRALETDVRLIGINNRDLHTFDVDLATTWTLADNVPADRLLVTESGIHTGEHVATMRQRDIHAFLVGEAFMRAEDPGEQLRALFA